MTVTTRETVFFPAGITTRVEGTATKSVPAAAAVLSVRVSTTVFQWNTAGTPDIIGIFTLKRSWVVVPSAPSMTESGETVIAGMGSLLMMVSVALGLTKMPFSTEARSTLNVSFSS